MSGAVTGSQSAVLGYDIVGDVHGCADMLQALLEKMDYRLQAGAYQHAARRVIFLGDLIDRGPQVKATVDLVRAMVEAGHAEMVLGNHEYVAILYATPSPPGAPHPYLRQHNERTRQILKSTLLEYRERPDEWENVIQWFRSLPLFLEKPDFRVVHACWDQRRIDQLVAINPAANLQSDGFLQHCAERGSEEFRIVERLLKGTDIPLPAGMQIRGGDGFVRDRFRAKFWKSSPTTYGDIVFQPDQIPSHLLGKPLSEAERLRLVHYHQQEKPLFVGHYWRRGRPRLIRDNIACLDYSAVRAGSLVAYRFDVGDTVLTQDKLCWVAAHAVSPKV